MTAQREIRLITAAVVAAEGICPDVVLRVVNAQVLGCVVRFRNHIQPVQTFTSGYCIRSLPSLELNVLEVIRALIAPLVLHPQNRALAFLCHHIDSRRRADCLRLFRIEVFRIAIVAVDGLALFQRIHQRIVTPVFNVRAKTLQQLVGVSTKLNGADGKERIAILLIHDVRTLLLRPLLVLQPELQLPRLQA